VAEEEPTQENADAGQQAVEKIESSDGRHADEKEERPFDAQIRERPVQAFKNPVSPPQ
jgi:hypothetical protein